jgi:hypothetical protein
MTVKGLTELAEVTSIKNESQIVAHKQSAGWTGSCVFRTDPANERM